MLSKEDFIKKWDGEGLTIDECVEFANGNNLTYNEEDLIDLMRVCSEFIGIEFNYKENEVEEN